MSEYEAIVKWAAVDEDWFAFVQYKLHQQLLNTASSPLFDMGRWVRNYEPGLTELVRNPDARKRDV
eukprot:scaffold657_cov214-Amphora_coffeaeformis.AAC.8